MRGLSFRTELALVGAALFFIAFFATYKLSDSPAIWYDEGFYTQLAMNLAEGRGQVLQVAPGQYVSSSGVTAGFPLVAPVALSYKLFGTGVVQGRAVMVAFMLLTIIAAYALVRVLFGAQSALLALALMATYPAFYGNGKSVLGEVPGLFFLMLTLAALVWLERSSWRDMRAYAAAGLAAGLCVATKPVFILLGLAGISATLLASRARVLSWKGVPITVAAFLIPTALWAYAQLGQGDSLSSLVSFYLNPYEYPPGGIARVALSNALRFLKELSPLYSLLFVGAWAFGIAVRARAREHVSAAEWTAFLFSSLVLIFYLRTPGWYRYFFPATMLAILFAPHSLEFLYARVTQRVGFAARVPVIAACVCMLAFFQMYQLGWSSWVASYYASTRTEDLQAFFATTSPFESFFLYNVPEVAVLLLSDNYYQFLRPHPQQLIGKQELSVLERGTANLVIVNGETYRADRTPFGRYRVKAEVNRYTVLERL